MRRTKRPSALDGERYGKAAERSCVQFNSRLANDAKGPSGRKSPVGLFAFPIFFVPKKPSKIPQNINPSI